MMVINILLDHDGEVLIKADSFVPSDSDSAVLAMKSFRESMESEHPNSAGQLLKMPMSPPPRDTGTVAVVRGAAVLTGSRLL